LLRGNASLGHAVGVEDDALDRGSSDGLTLSDEARQTLAWIEALDKPWSRRYGARPSRPSSFATEDFSDVNLIPALRNSRVAAILGGHTYEALDPAPVIDGIMACNAGAHAINVNKVTLTRTGYGSISVQSKLVAQDHAVPSSDSFLAARTHEQRQLEPLQEEHLRLTDISGDRALMLLIGALRNCAKAAPDAIAMVARLYMLNPLPESDTVSHLEVMTAYPNAEPPGGDRYSRSVIERADRAPGWDEFLSERRAGMGRKRLHGEIFGAGR
jgi:hypothetical protein